jgi:chromosome segregation ATPase
LSELTKYEIVLNELISLEVQVAALIEKNELLQKHKKEQEQKIIGLTKENELLVLKLAALETEINNYNSGKSGLTSTLQMDVKEKENIKNKIHELINKIDYHVKSS